MSKPTLTVASVSARAGERAFGEVPVRLGEAEVRLPVFVINGAGEGPTLSITAGVHGCEFAGVQAALETAQTLDAASLKGGVIVAAVSNPLAFWQKVPFVCPLDQKNLNRQFPGRSDGSPSEALAHWLFQEVIRRGDYYVDLHGGDLVEALCPFVIYAPCGDEAVDRASLEAARSYGIRYVVEGKTKGSGYGAATQAGIPAFLAEAGEMGMWTPEMVAMHTGGLQRVLRQLGMTAGEPLEPKEVQMLSIGTDLLCEQDGLFYPEVKLGQWTKKGDRLGTVRDLAGCELQVVEAVEDAVILVIYASLPARAGAILFETGIRM